MDSTNSWSLVEDRGEAEGAQSTPSSAPTKAAAAGHGRETEEPGDPSLWDRDSSPLERVGGVGASENIHIQKDRLGHDPLAEAAMNILGQSVERTFEQRFGQSERTVDDGEEGTSDDTERDTNVSSDKDIDKDDHRTAVDLAQRVSDLHIDIPDPVVKLKRRSSSVTALSDVEATGCVERFSPRDDPIGSAVGSLPLHATTPSSITSSSSSATELGGTGSNVIPPIDPAAIQDLEKQCKRVSDSLDLMLGHLSNSLHNMSAITVGHIQTYRDAVEKAGITVDQSVKAMYALMAKVEELNYAMPLVYDLATQIKSIHNQLDELEALCK